MEIVLDNIEYIIGIAVAAGAAYYFKTAKQGKGSNDLSKLVIKYNRQRDAIANKSRLR